MSGNIRTRFIHATLLLFVVISGLKAQDLIAVLDVVSDGTIPPKYCTIISDTISTIIAKDTSYIQFDRTMIPELLQQLTVDEAATACSDPQCLVLIGNLIGANYVVGGFIRFKDNLSEIELNLVSTTEKRAINTVSLRSGSKKSVILSTEIPDLVADLFNPGATPPETKLIATKKSLFANPMLYIGTVVVGGLVGGGLYYQYSYKPNHTSDTPQDPSLYGDFPVRSE